MPNDMSEIIRVRKHREKMLDSYLESIRTVGGCPKLFLDSIETMTVAEMMEVLAQNHIRFTVDAEFEKDCCGRTRPKYRHDDEGYRY